MGRKFLGMGDSCSSKTSVCSIVNSGKIQTSDWLGLGLIVGVIRTSNQYKLILSCLLYHFLTLLLRTCILTIHNTRKSCKIESKNYLVKYPKTSVLVKSCVNLHGLALNISLHDI